MEAGQWMVWIQATSCFYGGSPIPCLGLATHHCITHARHTLYTAALLIAANQAAPRRLGLTGVQMGASFRTDCPWSPSLCAWVCVWKSVYVLTAFLWSLLGERLLVLVGEPAQYGLSSSSASCQESKREKETVNSCIVLTSYVTQFFRAKLSMFLQIDFFIFFFAIV